MSAEPGRPPSFVPRSRYLLLAAIIVLPIGFLQSVGAIDLPFGTWFSTLGGSVVSSASLRGFMANYGYASVFVLMALESASLPVPSEVVLPLAGYFVSDGTLSFWPVVIVSTVASLMGALADYYLAKWLGRPFAVRVLGMFRVHRDALARAEAWFGRSAQWTVFAARFVPALRTAISLPAGLFEMSVTRFIVMPVAGCFAWSAILVYAGLLAGSPSAATFASSSTVVDGLSGLVAAMGGAYLVFYFYPGRRRQRQGASPPSSGP